MNKLQMKGDWNVAKGKLKQKWAKLTDDDLRYQEGLEDELVGRIQRQTGSTNRSLLALHQQPSANNHMNLTIQFSPNRTAHCLWTEAISLHDLGRFKITRATKTEFNNMTQHWEVIDRKGKVRFFARSRCACLEWEQENLQLK